MAEEQRQQQQAQAQGPVPAQGDNITPDLTAVHCADDAPLYEVRRYSTGSTCIANHLAGSGIMLSPPDIHIPPKTFTNYQSATTEFREQTNAVIKCLAHTGKIVPVTDAAEIADLVMNPLMRPKDAAASSVWVILDPS